MQLPAIGVPEVVVLTAFVGVSYVAWKFVQAIRSGLNE